MQFLENGAIIGNYLSEDEDWKKIGEDVYELQVNGQDLTLCFCRIGPKACGMYAPTPKGHRHSDMEQLTFMLKGHATVVVDGKRTPVREGSHWLAPTDIDHGLDLRESPEGVLIVQIFPAGHRAGRPD